VTEDAVGVGLGPSGLNGTFDLGVVVFVLHGISQRTPAGVARQRLQKKARNVLILGLGLRPIRIAKKVTIRE
jgi:hypothetical protein